MKKLAILLAITLLLFLTACGEQESENNFYRVISVNKKKLTAIQACYEWGDNSSIITMQEGWDEFEMFRLYFDCEVEEVEMPLGAYEVDPVSFVFEMGDQKVEVFFITTEEENGDGQTVYLIQDEKAYRLPRDMNDWNEIREENFLEDVYEIELPRNPIQEFLFFTQRRIVEKLAGEDDDYWTKDIYTFEEDGTVVTFVGEKPALIGRGGMLYHLYRSYEEMLQETDYVVIGTIQDIRLEKVRDFDYMLMSALLTVQVDEVLCGESDTEEIEVLRWGDSIQVGSIFRPFGLSEHKLQVGDQYLFFMNEENLVDRYVGMMAEGLVDRYVGMMEITEDGMLRPTFSVSLGKIEEYYIPLQALKDML